MHSLIRKHLLFFLHSSVRCVCDKTVANSVCFSVRQRTSASVIQFIDFPPFLTVFSSCCGSPGPLSYTHEPSEGQAQGALILFTNSRPVHRHSSSLHTHSQCFFPSHLSWDGSTFILNPAFLCTLFLCSGLIVSDWK